MSRRRISQNKMKALCAELGPDDGVDPRDLLRQTARKKGGRKTQQLCGQVAEALDYALSACNDDMLREMGVVAVQPAPDQSRLLVSIGPTLPGPFDPLSCWLICSVRKRDSAPKLLLLFIARKSPNSPIAS
jgi:hypothetical protein